LNGGNEILELKNIKKDYHVGDQTFQALKGINLKFGKNEFLLSLKRRLMI